MWELLARLLGDSLALRLGLSKPEYISENNLIVHSYIESVDGAYLDGVYPKDVPNYHNYNNGKEQNDHTALVNGQR